MIIIRINTRMDLIKSEVSMGMENMLISVCRFNLIQLGIQPQQIATWDVNVNKTVFF